jgi:hypothetical protein
MERRRTKLAVDPGIGASTTLVSDTLFDGCAFGIIAVSPNRRILGFTVFLPSIGDSHG